MGKKRVFLLFGFAILAINLILAERSLANNDLNFVDDNHTSICVIDRPLDKRGKEIYGWEADIASSLDFVRYKGFFFSFDGVIQTISKDRALQKHSIFGNDLLSTNYNLVPGIGYEKDRFKIGLIFNHWSKHYYDASIGIKNINLVGAKYGYADQKQVFSVFLGNEDIIGGDYNYNWDLQILYQYFILNRLYVLSAGDIAIMNHLSYFDHRAEIGCALGQKNKTNFFLGYNIGAVTPPKGFYWGIRFNF